MRRPLLMLLILFGDQPGISKGGTPTCQLATFSALQYNMNVTLCENDAGIDVTALSAQPTSDQLTAFCGSNYCIGVLDAILAMHISECVVPINSGMLLVAQIINPIVSYCQAHNAQGAASASAAGSFTNTSVNSSSNSTSTTRKETKNAAVMRSLALCLLIIFASLFTAY